MMARVLVGWSLFAAACVVQPSPAPLKPGDGVELQNGVVSVDDGKVPVLPACTPGQLVSKTANGWECVTPAVADILKAGNGITVENSTIAAKFGAGHTDVATGDHRHDGVYRQTTEPIAWGDVTVSAAAVWPGSLPYAQITNAPVADWAAIEGTVAATDSWPGVVAYARIEGAPPVSWPTVRGTVDSVTPWPGTMDYSHLSNPPVIPTQYTDVLARNAVTWSSLKASVLPADSWPGVFDYSRLTNAPAVAWSTVKGTVKTSDSWPGLVDYSRLTNVPAATTWTALKPSVAATDVWPGQMDYARVTNTPAAATWSSIKGGVLTTDSWPGQMDFAQLTNVPTIPSQYTDAQAQAAVTWTSLKSSVSGTDTWPGKLAYSQLTNTPAIPTQYTDSLAQAAVTWNTVKGSVKGTDAWPGLPSYTDAQAQAAVTWNTVKTTVSSSTSWPGQVPYSTIVNAPTDLATLATRVATLESTIATMQAGKCPVGYTYNTGQPAFIHCTKAVNSVVDEMVKVGNYWIDRYEASSCGSGNLGSKSAFGTTMEACSSQGVQPATSVTWYQANRMCANVGKKLCSNAEWSAAAMGSPDNVDSNGAGGTCNTNSSSNRNTGQGTSCVTAFGAQDMNGNVWEWVGDWMSAGAVPTTTSTSTGLRTTANSNAGVSPDVTFGINTSADDSVSGFQTGLPAALARGGGSGDRAACGPYAIRADTAPVGAQWFIGFRCCLER